MRLYRFPKADGIDSLVLGEAAVPRPGPGQVLVRMKAWSLNYRDLMVAGGAYGAGGTRPDLVPLSDGAGEVVECGPNVGRVKAGDRICPTFFQGWTAGEISSDARRDALGGGVDGLLAEHVVVDERDLVHIPAHLSWEEAATLPCAGVTAWNALWGDRRLLPGETILVLGTGGVSVFALQFAQAGGATIIATSSSDEKLARAKSLGASATINYRQRPDWHKDVREITGGRGVDYVVEVGGAGTLPRSIEAARVGGTVALIGVLTGGTIDPTPIMRRNITLRGLFVGSRELFETMNRSIAAHALRPVIDRVFPFSDAKGAYRHLESAGHFGKVVIVAD